MELDRDTLRLLAAPFGPDELEWKAQVVKDRQALAVAYIDRNAVMNRLDFAVGPGNWSFDWSSIGGDPKKIKGSLTVLGITKSDAGEANAEDEPLKSAVSDALKRTAVHFGIGRYLSYLGGVWAGYDGQKRRFTERPTPPAEQVNRALRICGVVDGDAPAAQDPQTQTNGKRQRPPTQAAVERQERPLVEGMAENDPLARVTAKLGAVLIKQKLDAKAHPGLLKEIAQLALDAEVPRFSSLDAADRGIVVEWIEANPEVCRELQARIGRDQGESLPLEDTDASLPAQARGA